MFAELVEADDLGVLLRGRIVVAVVIVFVRVFAVVVFAVGFKPQAEFDGWVYEGAHGIEGDDQRFGLIAEVQGDGETFIRDGRGFRTSAG